uniref:hypothetical protein n=1 Tax=Altererythrobacter segetis TaxID=1104773 RepID=UPI00140E5D2B|nr:hypothetical protein [Altererythrobacter segetis]
MVEMTFPFAAYETPGADRLAIFADWLVHAVAAGAPELGIDDDEASSLKQRLSERDYIYVRTDKLKRAAGEPRCEVIYEHSPSNLVVTVRCKLPNGQSLTRTFRQHPLRPDELAYGRAISRCRVDQDGQITVEPLEGFG